MSKQKNDPHASTLAALLEEKPKRGRPPRRVSRQNVYVALSLEQKALMKELATFFPPEIVKADMPDLAVTLLSARMEALRRAVAGRNREIPEGVTDLESLFLLWDLSLPKSNPSEKWTSVRLSPQPLIELGRTHGILNAVFGATRSDTFGLGLALLQQFAHHRLPSLDLDIWQLSALQEAIKRIYL
jgi:hypothetical protein